MTIDRGDVTWKDGKMKDLPGERAGRISYLLRKEAIYLY